MNEDRSNNLRYADEILVVLIAKNEEELQIHETIICINELREESVKVDL